MRTVAVTLSGGNREKLAPDAWRSVVGVDNYLLIDTGESAKAAIRAAYQISDLVGRVTVAEFHRAKFDCAEARNFALDAAADLGFDWALMLDTDERMDFHGFDWRAWLSKTTADLVLVQNNTGEYPKPRFFRLPKRGAYRDRRHEIYVGAQKVAAMPSVTFSEAPKSKQELDASMAALLSDCEDWTEDEPSYERAWLHLGNCYVYHGHLERAAQAFRRSASLAKHPEEIGWAYCRAATCLFDLEQYRDTIELCVRGMAACPWFPELPYTAAWSAAKLNDHFGALAWTNICIAVGKTSTVPVITPLRVGFSKPEAHFEGPWELRAIVLTAMNMPRLAAEARKLAEKARQRKCASLSVKER